MIRRFFIVLQLVIAVFVVSGLGILTEPAPAEAKLSHSNTEATIVIGGALLGAYLFSNGLTISEAATNWTVAGEVINKMWLAVYKGVLLPIVRQVMLQWAAGQSDFPLFPLNLIDFLDYIVGTALNTFFNEVFGFGICDGIRLNIRLAIALLFFYGPFRLDFGFKGCKLSQIIKRSKFDFQWDIQIGLFKDPAASDIGFYFTAADEARVAAGQGKESVLTDFFASGGVLSMQDCSKDINGNGQGGDKPGDCRVTTPGGIMDEYLKESITGPDEAAKGSVYSADATALGLEAFAVYVNTFMMNKLQEMAGSKSTGGALKYDFGDGVK